MLTTNLHATSELILNRVVFDNSRILIRSVYTRG